MKVGVIGTGYVGLVTGTCFAEMGNNVMCVDNNAQKVGQLLGGELPIYEKGLQDYFERGVENGRLNFTTELEDGVKNADVVFLALPTNAKENGEANLEAVYSVAKNLGRFISKYTVVINKSTVPVGTAEKVREIISQNTDTDLFDVVSNPEFLREGQAVEDFLKPDRVVIGSSSERARVVMRRLYRPFVRQGHPILEMDERSAELSKYASNGFLATKISFMNEMANLAEKLGANIDNVRSVMGTDPRIGDQFLYAGIGYGGSCFPKDVKALSHMAQDSGYDLEILNAVNEVNERQKRKLVDAILEKFGGDIKDKTFAVWGLAFKANTDDVRESPALAIINELLKRGAKVRATDPEAIKNTKAVINDEAVKYNKDQYEVLEGADALIISTEWRQFQEPDFKKIISLLKNKIIFDGRNLFTPEEMQELGFYYRSIGRMAVG